MTKHKVNWNKKVVVYRRTHRDTSNAKQFFSPAFPKMIDYSTPIATFFPAEFPIEDWKDIKDFENWTENNLPETDGVYYFIIRNTLIQRRHHKRKKHKAGRPLFSREKLARLGFRNRPRQRVMEVLNCVAKIEMEHGQVVKTFEKKSPRKYPPYAQPTYELVRQIQKNAAL